MELKIGVEFEGNLTCAFKNDVNNLTDLVHRLTNSDFILIYIKSKY